MNQVVIGRFGRVRTRLAIAHTAHVDDAWIDRLDIRVGQAEPRHGLRAHVVDEHIGIAHQTQQCLAPFGFFQVQNNAALAAVGVQKNRGHAGMGAWAHAAHTVAAGGFHLDH
ncbi:MAG: hypothetical protein RR326_11755, partial [Stenotrophomonas sp.]